MSSEKTVIKDSEASGDSLYDKIISAFEEPTSEVLERLKGKSSWIQKQASGKVHIRPAMDDKKQMLCLNTDDTELYKLFNDAAGVFTKKFNGFHQVGWEDKNGLSMWELKGKVNISETELIQEFKEATLQELQSRQQLY